MKIKSFFIFQKIISLIQKMKKLELVTYNKRLQKRLGINIEDYKKRVKNWK